MLLLRYCVGILIGHRPVRENAPVRSRISPVKRCSLSTSVPSQATATPSAFCTWRPGGSVTPPTSAAPGAGNRPGTARNVGDLALSSLDPVVGRGVQSRGATEVGAAALGAAALVGSAAFGPLPHALSTSRPTRMTAFRDTDRAGEHLARPRVQDMSPACRSKVVHHQRLACPGVGRARGGGNDRATGIPVYRIPTSSWTLSPTRSLLTGQESVGPGGVSASADLHPDRSVVLDVILPSICRSGNRCDQVRGGWRRD